MKSDGTAWPARILRKTIIVFVEKPSKTAVLQSNAIVQPTKIKTTKRSFPKMQEDLVFSMNLLC